MTTSDSTTSPAVPTVTRTQDIWNHILHYSVGVLDVIGQGVARLVSLFSRRAWSVHFYVYWNFGPGPFVENWADHRDRGASAYTLAVGRVQYRFFAEPRRSKPAAF